MKSAKLGSRQHFAGGHSSRQLPRSAGRTRPPFRGSPLSKQINLLNQINNAPPLARRCLDIPLILLCSTDDPVTRNTWLRLGFMFTLEEDLQRFDVGPRDLLHMDNTVQVRGISGWYYKTCGRCVVATQPHTTSEGGPALLQHAATRPAAHGQHRPGAADSLDDDHGNVIYK